jgi:uncharacterized protein YbjT (DUF2867 family)
MKIVLVGGSGFLGRYLVHELVADGHFCTVLSRHTERRGSVRLEPGTKLVQADVYDPQALSEQFLGAGAVISMAGILNESGFSGKGFKRVHVDLTGSIIEACKIAGVSRVLHISALNAGKGKSHYLKTKGEAEEMLRSEPDLKLTILQPSVIFGQGDSFFNRFADLLRVMPVFPLACGRSRMQPVYAGDVAAIAASSLGDRSTYGKTYEVGGPRVYTLLDLVRFTAISIGLKRWVFSLPGPVSRLQAMILGLIPGKPFSMDNFRSLQVDCVTEKNALAYFGIVPSAIEAMVPDYLSNSIRQKRLAGFRMRAGR